MYPLVIKHGWKIDESMFLGRKITDFDAPFTKPCSTIAIFDDTGEQLVQL